jgi:proteasome accessory factor C
MSPRPQIGPRLERVLALVPWIAEHPGSPLDELAVRFDVTPDELERDLELLPFCGLPPYSPDRLIDVEIVEGRVWIRFAEYFARPLRLTADEGLGLLAAGEALLAVPGSDQAGSLATALDKLAATIGTERGVSVQVGGGTFLDALRTAADRREQVEIDYYSFGRDVTSTRRVDPESVFHAFGQWYVDAYCHDAGARRMFRVDRVRGVRPTGEHFTAGTAPDPDGRDSGGDTDTGSVFHPRADDARVTLRLGPDAGWVAESYPTESVTDRADGGWDVVLVVSERAFLERILLRLGPDAEVTAPPEWTAVGPEAARRVRARYG